MVDGKGWEVKGKIGVNIHDCFFFFKQKTAYEMCGRDWSSDVCSSDLYTKAAVKMAEEHPDFVIGFISVAPSTWEGGCGGEIGRASCRERV